MNRYAKGALVGAGLWLAWYAVLRMTSPAETKPFPAVGLIPAALLGAVGAYVSKKVGA